MNLREPEGRTTSTNLSRIVPVPATSNDLVDPSLQRKYVDRTSKLLERQSKLDEESRKVHSKYQRTGNAEEFNRKQAKLEAKRAKLTETQHKLASSYQTEAELKRCQKKDCLRMCPPGTVPGPRGCMTSPTPYSPPASDSECGIGFTWDGQKCIAETLALPPMLPTHQCSQYYSWLVEQKKMRDSIRRSWELSCTANSTGRECIDLTTQLNSSEVRYRELEREYNDCRMGR